MNLAMLIISLGAVATMYFMIVGFGELHKGKWGEACKTLAIILSCVLLFASLILFVYAIVSLCMYNMPSLIGN